MAPISPLLQQSDRRRDLRRRRVRRRRLLALAALAGALLLALIVVPWAIDKLGSNGRADPRGALVADLGVHSGAVGDTLHTTVVVPRGAQAKRENRPLLVFLHGRGGNHDSYLDDEPMFIALSRLGRGAPIVAFPDGGDHSYWHNREDGDWGDYLVREVIPRVARSVDANPQRVAIGGISMGGFGAYDLALKHPGRFCAAGGHSPALWRSAGETAPGAFDDTGDFARTNVVGAARHGNPALLRMPVWLDAGDQDPFQPGDRAFVRALHSAGAQLTAHTGWPGGHDRGYWDEHWPAYFRFYAKALGRCHAGS